MAHPTITALPPAPTRGEDFATFAQKANDHVAALTPWTDEVNAVGSYIETTAQEVDSDATAAAASAQLADDWANKTGATVDGTEYSAKRWATSISTLTGGFKGARGYAEDAESFLATVESLTNFKGEWADLTGSLNVPASVLHNGFFWQLLNNLADVATSEPSVSGDWAKTTVLQGNATGAIDMAGNALTTDAVYSDQVDKGTQSTAGATVTFDISAASSQKLTIGANTTIAFSNWSVSGEQSGVEIELVNGGSAAITWPTINWYVGDGTTSTVFADMGVTLAASGTNTLAVWSSDSGTTLYGVAV